MGVESLLGFFLTFRLRNIGPLLHRGIFVGVIKLWTVLLHLQEVLERLSLWLDIS